MKERKNAMNQQNIQMFISQNSKMFEPYQLQQIVNELQNVDDEKLTMISSANYKDPATMLIISILLGGIGVDRFMLGDTGIGVLKLLTGGCFGVLAIIDWFSIQKKTKEKNYQIFRNSLKMSDISQNFSSSVNKTSAQNTTIEQIKKYKQLLDDGVITKEEFEAKKKELL